MKNLENLKLSFPELEDSVKQSTKGGWSGYSDGGGGWGNFGGYGSPSNPFNLPPITITPGGSDYDYSPPGGYTPGGNPYWWGGQNPWGNWGYGDQGQDQGGGGGGGGYGTGTPLPTFNEDVIDVIETVSSVLTTTNEFLTDAAEIARKIGDEVMASNAIAQLEAVGKHLSTLGTVTMVYDAYVALSDGKLTVAEGTKLVADVVIGELAMGIPVAGPIIAFTYTALDATGQVDKFIDWIYPDKMEDEDLLKIWTKMQSENATGGKTFKETFGRDLLQDIFHNNIHDTYPGEDPYSPYNPINEGPISFIH